MTARQRAGRSEGQAHSLDLETKSSRPDHTELARPGAYSAIEATG
jgi:hypothetical protein